MSLKYNRFRVLEVFFRFPTTDLQLRQIARESKLSTTAAKRYIGQLVRQELVLKTKGTIYKAYKANRDNEEFRRLRTYTLCIQLSPIVNEICDACLPDAIVLFGSARDGYDIEDSDIDLAVLTDEVKIDVNKYEKRFNREISVMFFDSFETLSKELKNNILNGIALYGYVKAYPHKDKRRKGKKHPEPGKHTTGTRSHDEGTRARDLHHRGIL